MFNLWMKTHYPDFPLWHADHVLGSRQDDCANAVKCDFSDMLRRIDFLDELLRHKKKDNKLEQSLFIFLSSMEMIGMIRSMMGLPW